MDTIISQATSLLYFLHFSENILLAYSGHDVQWLKLTIQAQTGISTISIYQRHKIIGD